MSVEHLSIRGFRNLASVELEPAPGINWLVGENGAGKTSVLEALFVLARGRSFRSNQMGAVIGHESDHLMVVAHLAKNDHRPGVVMGVERDEGGWRGRLGGNDCQRVSDFARHLPVVLLEPDSHRLVSDGPQVRRQYLDWVMFHVEPSYLPAWQRYQKLLKQRNAALKTGATHELLNAIDAPMIQSAEVLNELRAAHVSELEQTVTALAETLGLRLPGVVGIGYRPGHAADQALADALLDQRERDREAGFTRVGPHRADLVVRVGGYPAAQESSRGQQKLLATLLLLAKWESLSAQPEHPPILLVDDPVSELDQDHLQRVMDWLSGQEQQVWVTATETGPKAVKMFHVERGQIRTVV